jgi:chromosome segregation ATPase
MAAMGAGIAVGVFSGRRRGGTDASAIRSLQRSVTDLEARVASQQQAVDARLRDVEDRLEEHAAKLAEIPSTPQIVNAIEQLLAKSLLSLDKRLTAQSASIEVLTNAVSQTDSFLERLLESQGPLQQDACAEEAPLEARPHPLSARAGNGQSLRRFGTQPSR